MGSNKKVQVFVRTRPTANFANDNIKLLPDNKTLIIHRPPKNKRVAVDNVQNSWCFKLDGILHNASQETVFQAVGQELVLGAFKGFNGTLMCYGQTGSGKTYTTTGAMEKYRFRGVIPRTLTQIFKEISQRIEFAITVRISYYEIYNDMIYDLLAKYHDSSIPVPQLNIYENNNGVFIKGLTNPIAANEEDALNIMFQGEINRTVGSNVLNKNSSRSHCIFSIMLQSCSRTESSAHYTTSKINLVDLAGSERLEKTQSQGKSQLEASCINKSLIFLEQTIKAMTEKRRDHIPYRQTKLTHALKDSLGGNCNTIMIANIWTELEQLDETISTLKFATKMMNVSIEPISNTLLDPLVKIKMLEKEIDMLKDELAMHDTLANQCHMTYDNIPPQQMENIQTQVKQYIAGSLSEIEIVNVRQIHAIFAIFKSIVNKLESDLEFAKENSSPPLIDVSHTPYELSEGSSSDTSYTGDLDVRGFQAGSSPSSLHAIASPIVFVKKTMRKKMGKILARRESVDAPEEPLFKEITNKLPTRTYAFETFKKEKGNIISRILTKNKEILNTKKNAAKNLAEKINKIKQQIEVIREKLQEKKDERIKKGTYYSQDGIVIDEEEYQMICKLKDLKDLYLQHFNELKGLSSEIDYSQKLVNQTRCRLLADFDKWFAECFLYPGEGPIHSIDVAKSISIPLPPIKIQKEKDTEIMPQDKDALIDDMNSETFTKSRILFKRQKLFDLAQRQLYVSQPSSLNKKSACRKSMVVHKV